MPRPSQSPASRFAAIVAAFADDQRVTPPQPPADGPRKFGSNALKIDGKIFAMMVDDRLVVKLPKARVAELAAAGVGVPFDSGGGRIMKEWLSVDGAEARRWLDLATEASRFVGGA